jgi:hypothetical protein
LRLIRESYGFDPWEAWLQAEMGRVPSCPRAARSFSAVRFFHPGIGTVRSVSGWGEATAIEGVVEARCKVRPGTVVTKRLGTGQSSGLILARGATRLGALGALARASERVRIELDASASSA